MLRLLQTPPDWTLTYLRLALGLIMLPHGAQKLLGAFGGSGYRGTVAFFDSQLGIPPWLTLLVLLSEFFGALLLILGLAGRPAAFSLCWDMAGAILVFNLERGFFWTSQGYEYPLFLLAIALVIVVRGSGAYSLDRALSRRAARTPRPARA